MPTCLPGKVDRESGCGSLREQAKGPTRNPARGWLERLGLICLARTEPPLLAALVTGSPLLLIGAHGTAKSLFLTRIAAALDLEFRHYNASLLNFDDLVGFPLPGKDGTLQYLHTPSSIWGASAVIFDEVSRCRPDIQNKLFPIIHERRVQRILLSDLHYRWAAMNPPSNDGWSTTSVVHCSRRPLRMTSRCIAPCAY